jgi:hypothetical protein
MLFGQYFGIGVIVEKPKLLAPSNEHWKFGIQ